MELQRAAQQLKEAKEKEQRMMKGVHSEEGRSVSESLTSSQFEAEQERLHCWRQQVAAHEQKRRAQKERETNRLALMHGTIMMSSPMPLSVTAHKRTPPVLV